MKNKILPLNELKMAGSREAPSSLPIQRCPKCYAWVTEQVERYTCRNCGHVIYLTHDGGTLGYYIQNARQKGILWALFCLFVWIPAHLLDRYLHLRHIVYFAILRVMLL